MIQSVEVSTKMDDWQRYVLKEWLLCLPLDIKYFHLNLCPRSHAPTLTQIPQQTQHNFKCAANSTPYISSVPAAKLPSNLAMY
jgi:hypothetical protein